MSASHYLAELRSVMNGGWPLTEPPLRTNNQFSFGREMLMEQFNYGLEVLLDIELLKAFRHEVLRDKVYWHKVHWL